MNTNKRPWHSRWLTICLAVFVGLTSAGLASGCGSGAGGQTAKATPVPVTTPTPLVAVLRASLAQARKHLKKVEVEDYMNASGSKVIGKQVTATYDVSSEDFWDEDNLIATLATDTVNVLAAGFRDARVKRVNVVYQTTMTDQYGNDSLEKAVEIDWTRALWSKVKDPAAFKERLIGDEATMYQLASWHYVHPGIWKNTKLPELGIPVMGGPD